MNVEREVPMLNVVKAYAGWLEYCKYHNIDLRLAYTMWEMWKGGESPGKIMDVVKSF